MSKSINKRLYQTLVDSLSLSVVKKSRQDGSGNSVSAALSKNGSIYIGGKIESDTNLLDISSEQAAIVKAVQQKDYEIREIVTLSTTDKPIVSPIVLKILIDFGKRIGKKIGYTLADKNGTIVWQTKDVEKTLPFYESPQGKLSLKFGKPQKNWKRLKTDKKPTDYLKEYALKGLKLAFTTYDGASSYGVAMLAVDGTVFWGGQYSAIDKRIGLHGEMAVSIAALMEGKREITDLAIVSDKFTDEPCTICGPCRQFLSELSTRFGWNLSIHCFAKEKNLYTMYTINSLLPHSWQSKKW